MIDQSHVDLAALIGRTVPLHRVGRTLRGRCPLHAGKTDSSLTLFDTPDGLRWKCQAGCGGGDAIAWLTKAEGLDFKAACAALACDAPARPYAPPPPRAPDDTTPPPALWQAVARQRADEAAARLWTPAGSRALAWLHGRGLTDATIQSAGLGYTPADTYTLRADFGLPVEADGPRMVAFPRGVTIPWYIGGDLWKLWTRTREHKTWPKYFQTPGGRNGAWGIDAVQRDKPVMLCEGIFDALAVLQEASDLVTPVVTGTTGARCVRWGMRLAQAPLALLSFDADSGGDQPRVYWADVLPRTKVWLPYYDDPGAMLTRPGSVRSWVLAGLDLPEPPEAGAMFVAEAVTTDGEVVWLVLNAADCELARYTREADARAEAERRLRAARLLCFRP